MLTATLKPYDAQWAPETLQISPNIKVEQNNLETFLVFSFYKISYGYILTLRFSIQPI